MTGADETMLIILLLWCCVCVGCLPTTGDVKLDYETGRFLPVPMHKAYRGRFGHSVGIKGSHVIVGSPHVHLGYHRSIGSAIVYTYDGNSWDKGVPLVPSGGSTSDGYGKSVAMGMKYAVVGSPYESREDRINSGAVYIYENYYGMWSLIIKLTSNQKNRGYLFGHTVAVSGDTVVVGSPMTTHGSSKGSVYVFTNKNGFWSEQVVLAAPLNGMRAEFFGSDVAIYKHTVVVFSYWKDQEEEYSIVLFVYIRNKENKWLIEDILLPPVTQELTRTFPIFPRMMKTGRFGASVSIHGGERAETIVIGEPNENKCAGVVFVYARSEDKWSLETTLHPTGALSHYKFGSSVAAFGDLIAVSQIGSEDASTRSQASVYLYKRSGDDWTLVRRLFASGGKTKSGAGAFVAMDKGNLVTASFNQWDMSGNNDPVFLFDIRDLIKNISFSKKIISQAGY